MEGSKFLLQLIEEGHENFEEKVFKAIEYDITLDLISEHFGISMVKIDNISKVRSTL